MTLQACRTPGDYGLPVPTAERDVPLSQLLSEFPPTKVMNRSESMHVAVEYASRERSRAEVLQTMQKHPDRQADGIILVRGLLRGRRVAGGQEFVLDGGGTIVLGNWPKASEYPDNPRSWLLVRRASAPRTWWTVEIAWPDDGSECPIPMYGDTIAASVFAQERRFELLGMLDLLDLGIESAEEQRWTYAALVALLSCDPCVEGEIAVGGLFLKDWCRETLGLSAKRRDLTFEHSLAEQDSLPRSGIIHTALQLPAPRLIKTARAAEEYAAEYLRAIGFPDATVTHPGADGGVDVRSVHALAQVKMEGVATGRPVIQALFGVASYEAKQPVFFSLAGYTSGALAWATGAGVACFEFEFDGEVSARNAPAQALLAGGTPRDRGEADEKAETQALDLSDATPAEFPRFRLSADVLDAVETRFGKWEPIAIS